MASRTAVYMKRLKEEHPEKHQELLKKHNERQKKRRGEKRRKWLEEPHTRAMVEEYEKAREAQRIRSQRCRLNKTKRTTRTSTTATTEPRPRTSLVHMTEDEKKKHRSAQRRDQRARQPYQKTVALRKKNTERMRIKREAVQENKLSKLQIVFQTTSKTIRNFTSEIKKRIKKKTGESSGNYAEVVKGLATPRTPEKRAAIRTTLGKSEVRRSLNLDIIKPAQEAKKKLLSTHSWKRKISGRRARQIHLRGRIMAFYMKSEVSRLQPHSRYATKNGPGYAMVTTIDAARKLFEAETGQTVCPSLFARLRPKSVRKLGAVPVETCLCIYCTNIRYKLTALGRKVSCSGLPRSETEVLDFILCPRKNEKWHKLACIDGDCKKCDDRLRPFILACRSNLDDEVSWHKDLLEELNTDLEHPVKGTSFFQHLFTAFWQYSQYKTLKTSLQPGQVMMVMDFAENRKATYATEVKSAHFGKGQWTLHPIVAFFKDEVDQLRQHVIMLMSDDINHDYHAVQTFTDFALKDLARHVSPITDIIIWSDGCASQYKGKGTFADLSLLSTAKVQRCYFGSEHGKGEADGATGVLSQAMSRAVASGQVFRNAKDLQEWAQANLSKAEGSSTRTFILVEPSDINRMRPKTEISTLPGSRAIHQIKRVKDYVLRGRKLACFCSGCQEDKPECCVHTSHVQDFETFKLKPNASVDLDEAFLAEPSVEELLISETNPKKTITSIKVGDFVEVKYCSGKTEQAYFGVVVSLSPSGASGMTVNFLRKKANFYVFPDISEIVEVSIDHAEVSEIRLLEAPIVSGRGHHFFYNP